MRRGGGRIGHGALCKRGEWLWALVLQAVHQLYLLTAGLAAPEFCPASPGPLISSEGINQVFMGLAEFAVPQMDY